MSDATNCPPCPACSLPVASPQMADFEGHAWDGRRRTYDPGALFCPACGHRWIEPDLDAVAKAWRAQAAHYAETKR